ncbi:MAG: UDP-N-acetylglucosamine 2-epimerase (non-hydrolyzing) [Elusimicrobia bacterium CG11_big_fil_rev_8_21_14_0_20_64_6]|nr:MAG: UDP-N-acetylglucosamine 2-epimerase (non-hydrolyzing) [Elusimicrobia bacterium CG11_big_fil_rev_8_21_14_0_20_64_6]
MKPGQSPNAVARRVLSALDPLLARLKPDLVVVQGDTTTAAAAAVSACRRGIPVAHVEAGLRSFDFSDPYPEELNRVLIDLLASLLFPPTAQAYANLKRENLRGRSVIPTGNTIVDALRLASRRVRTSAPARGTREVLVTLHRRNIHGAPFRRTCAALLDLVRKHEDLVLIYPLHPNPAIYRQAQRRLKHPHIRLLAPLPYPRLLAFMKRAHFVITDSGGLQEEAVCLHKPVLVVRTKTERPEIISTGAGRLVGLDPRRLTLWAGRLLNDAALHRRMSRARNPYGDGRASQRIAAGIARWLKAVKY